jgi:hypothetical protein
MMESEERPASEDQPYKRGQEERKPGAFIVPLQRQGNTARLTAPPEAKGWSGGDVVFGLD